LILKNLTGVALIEKDVNGDLLGWNFPLIDSDTLEIIKIRSGLNDKSSDMTKSRYSKFKDNWIYSLVAPIDSAKNPKVTSIGLCVLSEIFNPAKYQSLLEIFVKMYMEKNSPIPILEGYLSVFTRRKIESSSGNFIDADFDNRRAFIAPIKELFELFGVESIVIWVAILLKKRIFVYCDKLSDLLALVRAFPLLGGWHRQNFDMLRPFMGLTATEITDLQTTGVYVAGFTDSNCVNYKELYDLFIDISGQTCVIADHAKADFVLGKFHKDLAEGFLACAQNNNDQVLIKEVALKTKELISNLQNLKTKQDDGQTYITLEHLSSQKLPPNMDKFFYNVAIAEGMGKK